LNIRTLISGYSCFNFFRVAIPFISGISISRIITSGFTFLSFLNNSAVVPAVSTIWKLDTEERTRSRPILTIGWLSAIKTLINVVLIFKKIIYKVICKDWWQEM